MRRADVLHAQLRESQTPLLNRPLSAAWTGRPWEVQVAPSKGDERAREGTGSAECSPAPATGLARPGPSLPARDFTFRVSTYAPGTVFPAYR